MSNPMFDQITPWAYGSVGESDENGPKFETDDTFTEKISNGFTAERLPYPTLNRILNRADNLALSVQQNGIAMCGDGIDTEIMEGRMSAALATSHGLAASNRYTVGNTLTRFSRIWPCRIGGVSKCLAIDCAAITATGNTTLYIIDRDTGVVTTQDLVSGFNPSYNWALKGVCCDGDYVYVAAVNDSDSNYWVQAFDLSTWLVKAGWPEYGTSAISDGGWNYPTSLIFANSTYLAISGQTVGAKVSLISRATGAVASTGDGDYVSGDSYIYNMCSNGTYLFFTTGTRLCSARISSLSSGCGGTGWPLASIASGPVACLGDMVATCDYAGGSAVVRVARVQNATWATITLTGGTPYVGSVAFDDVSLWIRYSCQIGSTRRQALMQIGLAAIQTENGSAAVAISVPTQSYFTRVFDEDLVHPAFSTAQNNGVDMRWDGRDLWFGGEGAATANAFNPYIFRYPHTRNNRGILY